MGGNRTAWSTNQCPVGLAFEDLVVLDALVAHSFHRQFRRTPPGRDDPRLLDALLVVQHEHDAVTAEITAPKK